jgi:hypothetical protein
MKTVIRHSVRLACLAALLSCAQAASAQKQQQAQARAAAEPQSLAQPTSKLPIENLEALAARADRVVDVTLDENLLRFIPAAIRKAATKDGKIDSDAENAARIASGFKGVYVRSFRFDGAGQWKESDIAGIREQLRRPGWSRIVSVRTRNGGQNVEVYLMTDPASLGGLAVVATEPTELTVVNIVGRVSLEDLVTIQGHFPGLPDLGIDIGDSKDDERKPESKTAQPAAKKP